MDNIQKKKVHMKYELKRLYGKKCMLTGIKETPRLRMTYHHTNTKNCQDPSVENITVENGALLCEFIHCYFLHHIIERQRPELYKEIRTLLNRYKRAVDEGNTEVILLIEQSVMPMFRYFQENQTETRRRVKVYEKMVSQSHNMV